MPIIELKSLTKKFNGFTAVDSISFGVNEGEIFGFLGPNGAGKTTTISMLATILRPVAGTALINKFDINKEKYNVRKSIGIVFQDVFLFSATIRENIAYGRPAATFDAIAQAARAAQLHDFIVGLPEG